MKTSDQIKRGGSWIMTCARVRTGKRLGMGHRRRLLLASVAPLLALAGGAHAQLAPTALPQGGVVIAGGATIAPPTGAQLTVTQSTPRAVINWNSFDIGAQAKVSFVQPAASASVLNRVLSSDPTQIFGQLSANGRLFIVNPSGIVFGRGSRIDAGGLVASTLDITNADFMAGRQNFTRNGAAGAILNQGSLHAAPGGYVALLGATVTNTGSIDAPHGSVVLAAGDAVRLPVSASGLITLEVDPATVNATLANDPDGVISAADGQVYLSAAAASGLAAQTLNRGRIDVSSVDGVGGSVKLLGDSVGLFAGSQVLATGATGGGTVLVGGGYQGKGPEANASAVYMDKDARIDASAIESGAGGKVVLWSQDYTGFFGSIAARGGAQGGDGGFVETSSRNNLQAFGAVDAAAPHGAAGQWLLDPTDVTIVAGAVNSNDTVAGGVWTPTTNTAQIGVTNINTDLNAGTSVVVNTASAGAGVGGIAVSSAIAKTAGASTSLTLNAAGVIAVNAGISSTSNQLAITLNAAGGAVSGTGAINTNGGLLTVNAASGSGTLSGVISGSGGLTKTGAGTLRLSGTNTYSGGTAINGGTLQVSSNANLGAVAGVLSLDNGTLQAVAGSVVLPNRSITLNAGGGTFDGAGGFAMTLTGVVSGVGGLTKTSINQLGLSANNTYAGTTTISGGILALFTNGTIPGNVVNNGTLQFSRTNTMTYGGVISGTGAVVQAGSGTTILTGNNTYNGATTINAGTLQVGANGATGTLGLGAVTNNSNLIFNRSDTVSLSTLASNAAGIGGTGNVTALIGGGFTVDRGVTLTGANSTILLEAGKAVAAGDATGGDVTLTSNISTSAGGTVTIFSGNANTAALEAKITGASGATRFKTYNASAANTAGAVAGTRNYYYRQAPTTTVSGITASNKAYDATTAATINIGGATATAIDGDSLSVSATSGSFADKNAGAGKTVTVTGVSVASNTPGVTVSGYQIAPVTTTANITPASLTLTANANSKTYDGTTAAGAAPTASGLLGSDTVTGLTEAYANKNAGTGKTLTVGAGYTISDGNGGANYIVTTVNDTSGVITPASLTLTASANSKTYDGTTGSAATPTASGLQGGDTVTGLFQAYADRNAGTGKTLGVSGFTINDGNGGGNYTVTTIGNTAGVITPASLTVTANNDAKFVTKTDAPGYAGASFTGFVGGDTSAALGGALSITRTNASTESAGIYNGVLAASGLTSSNYNITYVVGDYTIVPANQLLVRLNNVTSTYGATPAYTVQSAQYMLPNTTVVTVGSSISGGAVSVNDGVGGAVSFGVAVTGAMTSTSGALRVGNYQFGHGAVTGNSANFSNTLTVVGARTVSPLAINVAAGGVAKTYDATTSMSGLTLTPSGILAGDLVSAGGAGAYASPNAGTSLDYTVSNLALSGADAANYAISGGSSFSAANGVILPAALTVIANNDAKFVTKTDAPGYAGVSYAGFVGGETSAVLGGALAVTRTNAGTESVGAYSGVLAASGLTSSNYNITYATGDYTIVPANQLLVRLNNVTSTYGTTPAYTVQSAQYMLPDTTVVTVGSSIDSGAVSVNDGVGGGVNFGVAVTGAMTSTSGALRVGSYQLDHGAVTGSSANFSNTLTVVGARTVTPLAISLAAGGVSKTYDATTGMSGLTLTAVGLLAGDLVAASGAGAYSSKNAGTGLGYTVFNLALSGADAANYAISGGSSFSGADGVITPARLTLTAIANRKFYDGDTTAGARPTVTGLLGADTVAGLSEAYADKTVGKGKTLRVSRYTINDGNGGGNYVIIEESSTAGEIDSNPSTISVLSAVQRDLPVKIMQAPVAVPVSLEGRLLEAGYIQLTDILPLIPEITAIVSVGETTGAALPATATYDATTGRLYYKKLADLPEYLMATGLDRDDKLRHVKVRLISDPAKKVAGMR